MPDESVLDKNLVSAGGGDVTGASSSPGSQAQAGPASPPQPVSNQSVQSPTSVAPVPQVSGVHPVEPVPKQVDPLAGGGSGISQVGPTREAVPPEGGDVKKIVKIVLIIVGIIVVLGLVAVAVLFLVSGENPVENVSESNDKALTNEELIASLRQYEIEWSEEMKQDWETRKSYPFEYTVTYALYEVPRFESGKKVLTVGEEELYTEDFNYRLFVSYNKEFTSGDPLSDELLMRVVDEVVDGSVTLQKGAEENMVVLHEDIYESMEKDFRKRNEAVGNVTETVMSVALSEVNGRSISAWFYNIETPEMGVDEAREYCGELIGDLRSEVEAGEISMEEAGDVLRNDPVLIQIDAGLSGNAYESFVIKGDKEVFHDPKVQKEIMSLSEGELSDVIVGRDMRGENDWYDAFFLVVYMDEKEPGVGSFSEWLKNGRDTYEVEVVENL